MAENLATYRVSSYVDAHWLMLTIMQERPRPVKKPWNTRVNLLSRKGTTVCFSLRREKRVSPWESKTASPHTPFGVVDTHLDCWFWRRAAMQRPNVWREVLMLFASFIRSPLFWSLQRSDPARSHRDNLKKTQTIFIWPTRFVFYPGLQFKTPCDHLPWSPSRLPHKGTESSFGVYGLLLDRKAYLKCRGYTR